VYNLFFGQPNSKRPHGIPKRRWVDNVKMNLVELRWGGVDWIGLSKERGKVENSYECGNEPAGSIKCWETVEWLHNW
jgi:hypothetical protein